MHLMMLTCFAVPTNAEAHRESGPPLLSPSKRCRSFARLGKLVWAFNACRQVISDVSAVPVERPHPCRVAPQIETLAGQVLAAEVGSRTSLVAMRAGIERETGVLAEQQRLLILGAPLAGSPRQSS